MQKWIPVFLLTAMAGCATGPTRPLVAPPFISTLSNTSALTAQEAEGSFSDALDNLFVDLTTGVIDEPRTGASDMGSLGANYGLPILEDQNVGFQIGGDFTLREINPELDISAGAFKRGIELGDGIEAGAAALFDYRHTQRQADLFAARPTAGVDISDEDYVGGQAVIPFNSETVSRSVKRRQRMIPRVDGFWGHRWSDKIQSEVTGGYMFDKVDSAVFGGQLNYSLNESIDLAGIGEFNFDGDYTIGVSLVYDVGKNTEQKKTSTMRWFGSGAGFTPFPKRSFPYMVVDTWHRFNAVSGVPAEPGDCPTCPPIPPIFGDDSIDTGAGPDDENYDPSQFE